MINPHKSSQIGSRAGEEWMRQTGITVQESKPADCSSSSKDIVITGKNLRDNTSDTYSDESLKKYASLCDTCNYKNELTIKMCGIIKKKLTESNTNVVTEDEDEDEHDEGYETNGGKRPAKKRKTTKKRKTKTTKKRKTKSTKKRTKTKTK